MAGIKHSGYKDQVCPLCAESWYDLSLRWIVSSPDGRLPAVIDVYSYPNRQLRLDPEAGVLRFQLFDANTRRVELRGTHLLLGPLTVLFVIYFILWQV